MLAPTVHDLEVQQAFRAALLERRLDPSNRWIGGYVDYEWNHARHLFEGIGIDFQGLRVLEFGCNFGATAIVLAHLGAYVTAVDVNAHQVDLARLNAGQYRLQGGIAFAHVADSRTLPFSDGFFDVVVCNSVLEYVPADQLQAVQTTLDRVLKPGGSVLVIGTSNRLAPREVHSGRWLVNYLPTRVDRLLGAKDTFQRGLSPLAARRGFGPGYVDLDRLDGAASYLRAQEKMGANPLKLRLLDWAGAALRPFGWSAGMLTPNICLRLRKRR